MAPASPSSEELVGPTEEVVQAFIEHLVEPILHRSRVSVNNPPSLETQTVIATQMHAVVVLYNYFHRKQRLDLNFLDFVSFCELAMKFRPALTSCMKIMKRNDPAALIGEEDQFSITEKAIKDACDLAVALDPAEDVPIIEGFPIGKVAVLVVDSDKKNCFLHYGTITEGAWSVIEKDVSQDLLALEKAGNKRKRDDHEESNEDKELLKLAFLAVKDATGIESSDLVVIDSLITHSLSKKNSAVKFYIMQWSQRFGENNANAVQLSALAENLQGPLAEKFLNSWTASSVVEHFLILPYAMFITTWFWGKDRLHPTIGQNSSNTVANQIKDDQKNLKHSHGYNIASSDKTPQSTGKRTVGREECNVKPNILDFTENDTSRSDASSGNSHRTTLSEASAKDGVNKLKSSGSRGFARNEVSRVNLEKTNTDTAVHSKNLHSRTHLQNTMMNGNASKKLERTKIEAETLGNGGPKNLRMASSGHSKELQRKNPIEFTDNGLERENNTGKRPSSEQHRSNDIARVKNDDVHGPDVGVQSQVEMEHCAADIAISRSENIGPAIMNRPVQFEMANYNIVGQNKLASDNIHNDALSLLNRRRQDLYSQLYSMEDKLTRYEDYIERIRDGGDADLARKCLLSILSGNSGLVAESDEEHGNRSNRSSTAFVLGKTPCQDLEYICLRNDWRLPRYFVELSDGKFQAKVFVIAKDINLRSEGSLESKPSEARESAAAQMITDIKNTFA